MTMDVEAEPLPGDDALMSESNGEESRIESIIKSLTMNEEVIFKSQQRGEADLTVEEKLKVALEIFNQDKCSFLIRFGRFLSLEDTKYFQQFSNENEEIQILLRDLIHTKSSQVNIKNRRYEALQEMIRDGNYFSDVEMMKRNPLLYEQLIGQYLTFEEKKLRDKEKMYQEQTFVKILMEGIERDNAEVKKQQQLEDENEELEEDSNSGDEEMMTDNQITSSVSDNPPCYSQWGEYDGEAQIIKVNKPKNILLSKDGLITSDERHLLREEFLTTMYQNFLDGKDEDFDYSSVDNNDKYDNRELVDLDEEDKYFDSEEPADAVDISGMNESSEDELDIFMSALNNHPSVVKLSNSMKRL